MMLLNKEMEKYFSYMLFLCNFMPKMQKTIQK